MIAPTSCKLIKHLKLKVNGQYDTEDGLSTVMTFLSKCTSLNRLDLDVHPCKGDFRRLKKACPSLEDLHVNLYDGHKKVDASLLLELAPITRYLCMETPIKTEHWQGLCALSSSLCKLDINVAVDHLPSLLTYMSKAETLENLTIRNLSRFGFEELGTLTAEAWRCISIGIECANRLHTLNIHFVDNDQALIVSTPEITVPGIISSIKSFGSKCRSLRIEASLTTSKEDSVYKAMIEIILAASQYLRNVDNLSLNLYSTDSDGWEVDSFREKKKILDCLFETHAVMKERLPKNCDIDVHECLSAAKGQLDEVP